MAYGDLKISVMLGASPLSVALPDLHFGVFSASGFLAGGMIGGGAKTVFRATYPLPLCAACTTFASHIRFVRGSMGVKNTDSQSVFTVSVPLRRRTHIPVHCLFLFLMKHLFLALLLALGSALPACAQSKLYQRYIDRYSEMAVDQMRRYGIPASITLAQGLLESAAGTSRLVTKGNNHFGIKCGGVWKGPYMLMTDDAPNEKFRVYKNAAESYEDHSRFLRYGPRYAFLFKLAPDDYKGWAKGLKKAGYATAPHYATSLISIIEKNNLQRFDKLRHESRKERHEREKLEKLREQTGGMAVRRCNGQYYVIAGRGDTYAAIARRMKVSEKKLRKYNDVDKDYILQPGDVVYLGQKAKKAHPDLKRTYHTLKAGETLYAVSQHYGIRLENLCKMNPIPADYHFKEGDRIRLK